jgi:hypothetical protein
MKFADIKAGDTVVESCHQIHGPGLLRQVERVTNTQIIVNHNKYRRTDGKKIGDTDAWHPSYLMPATTELIAAIRQHEKIQNAKRRLALLCECGEHRDNTAGLLEAMPHIEAAIAVFLNSATEACQ